MTTPDIVGPDHNSVLRELRAELRTARRIAIAGILALIAVIGGAVSGALLAFPYFVPRSDLDALRMTNDQLTEEIERYEAQSATLAESVQRASDEADRLTEALRVVEASVDKRLRSWWTETLPADTTSALEKECPGSPTACYEIARRLLDETAITENCGDVRDDSPQIDRRLCELDRELGKLPANSIYATAEERRSGELLRKYLGDPGACPKEGAKYGPGCALAAEHSMRLARAEKLQEKKDTYYLSGWVYHQRACRLGIGHSCQQLAYAYTNGATGIAIDMKRAEGFAIAACVDGDALGCDQARYIFGALRAGLSVPDSWLSQKARERGCEIQPSARFCRK